MSQTTTNAPPSLAEFELHPISDAEFKRFAALIHEQCGIKLEAHKRTMLSGRLNRLLRVHKLTSFEAYYRHVRKDKSGRAISELVDAVTTNHTYFGRESAHFDYLIKHALPETAARLQATGSHDLRVWCAAASTGEEPYTLALTLRQYFGDAYRKWQAGLLATDICTDALNSARQGIYEPDQIKALSPNIQRLYFESCAEGKVAVKPELTRDVTFRRFNLMTQKFPFRQKFDIIFCRNVMIYFDTPTKDALAARLRDCTNEGGYLFIGLSESLQNRIPGYQSVAASVYKKVTI